MPSHADLVGRRHVSAGAVTIVAHDVGAVGGLERQLAELALGLRGRGHDVTVIARKCVLPEGSGIRVKIVRVPRRPFLVYYLWFLITGSLAVARHRRGVVQVTGAIVLNRVDAVSIHTLHQVYSAGAPRHGSAPMRAYARLVAHVKRALERLCFQINAPARFVCVSSGVAAELREHYPSVDPSRVVAIPNGVDTAAFAPGVRREQAAALRRRLGLEGDPPVLAFVGGNWEDKGLRLLIEALAGAPAWELVVAGAGDPDPYRRLAAGVRVERRVHWLGVVQDIQTVYELADAVALPSRYEAFPLVSLEAAASGVPVLATPVSGVTELVRDGVNGYLVRPDGAELAARLRTLAGDPQLRVRMGQAAREAALAFDSSRMVDAYEQLFQRLEAAHART